MAVPRATGAVPSSACPTPQGGCAAAPPATAWCVGWHVCQHCPARPRSRLAPTSRAASPRSRSAMGAPTALMALMSLTVSACPQPGRAGVLAGRWGPAQSPPLWEVSLGSLIYAHPSRPLQGGVDTGPRSSTIRHIPCGRTETSLTHSCTQASAARPQPAHSPWPPGAWRALPGTPQH